MKRTEFLQETRKMRFEEAYEGCKSGYLIPILLRNSINNPIPSGNAAHSFLA